MTAHQRPASPMRAALAEYAAHDAMLLFNEFVRESLLLGYCDNALADAAGRKPYLQRQLTLRLLSQCGAASQRFTWTLLQDLREAGGGGSALEGAPRFALSPPAAALRDRIGFECRTELAMLSQLLSGEDAAFSLVASPFGPQAYACNLEGTLRQQRFADEECAAAFRGWAGTAFAKVMQHTYAKYTRVLMNQPEVAEGNYQDFVQTWPVPLQAPQRA